jgi:UDP-glucose 4-epimerase
VTIYGTGKQERDYVFVGDVVAANVLALTKGENGVFNIGTRLPTSVNTLYEKLAQIHGSGQKPIFAPPRAGEVERSVLDASLAEKQLGWKPAHTLEQGLEKTYRYFQKLQPSVVTKKS